MQTQNVRQILGQISKTVLFTTILLVAFVFLGNASTSAQEPEQVQSASSAETVTVDTTGDQDLKIIPDEYKFVAVAGDNMSILTRRAIDLYDQADDSIKLSKAQVIYIETNIVQSNGPRLLDIGDSFSVKRANIEKYISMAPGLSEAQLAAWNSYAQRASFELNDITPTNVPLTDNGDLDVSFTPNTSQPTVSDNASNTETGASAYWWVVGAAAVLGLGFLLWPKRKTK